MGRHDNISRDATRQSGPGSKMAMWVTILIVAIIAVAAIGYAAGGGFDKMAEKVTPAPVSQGDSIDTGGFGDTCLIGVTDGNSAWTSQTCVGEGQEVSSNGRVIGVAGDKTNNGLISIELHEDVSTRNDFENVTVVPSNSTNLRGIEVCATGPEGTIYGCDVIDNVFASVASIKGFYDVPAGSAVWVRSTVGDNDMTSAQLLGIVSVASRGQEADALVSLIPVVGGNIDTGSTPVAPESDNDNGKVVTIEQDAPAASGASA